MKITHLMVLFIMALTCIACGKKGPVQPLEANLPNAVRNVELMQHGGELHLSWQLPTSNQNGTPLEKPPVVEIYRMLFDPQDSCPECKDRSTLLYSIDPELPEPSLLIGGRYFLRDKQVAAGQGYHYRLVPVDSTGQHGQSLIKRVAFFQPHKAPTGLKVAPHNRSTVLSWEPLQPASEMALLGYHVYHRMQGEASSFERITKRAQSETSYNDYNLANGSQYDYQVRALLQKDGQTLESLPSLTVSATPQPEL